MKYDAIVVANGKGQRAKLGYNKSFFVMKNNKTVLENACNVFIKDDECNKIIIVTDEKEKVFNNNKVVITEGGDIRSKSVKNGLKLVTSDYVMIHDAARPFINLEDINKIKNKLEKEDAVVLVSNNVNTLKEVQGDKIIRTIDRNVIYNALTPQSFNTKLIKAAYDNIDSDNMTDDSLVVEQYGKQVCIVVGDPKNIKLTDESDFNNI